MDMVTNYIETNLGRGSYSLWTNLVERKIDISNATLNRSEDQVSYTLWKNKG